MNRVRCRMGVLVAAGLVATGLCGVSSLAAASQPAGKAKILAQKLVEETLAKHAETDEIGISVRSSHGCKTIASTDSGDIGETCEKSASEPMRTGKPHVEKEKDGYDISVALHDATGTLVGSLGIGFKRAAGQTETGLVELAGKISREMEAQIPSRASLIARGH
jgi:hypothetical protein